MEILDVIVALAWLIRRAGRAILNGMKNSCTRFDALDWRNTEAVIQAITVESPPGGLRIDYEYNVNGTFHAGTRRVEFFTKSGASAFASRLKWRATYVIYHDPERPWRSWLPDDALLVREAEDYSASPIIRCDTDGVTSVDFAEPARNQFVSLKKVVLGKHHLQPQRVGVTITAERTISPKPPFARLEIAHYLGDDSCYLFHISSNGEGTDTWHETLDEALGYAEAVYGVKRTEWLDVNYVFGSSESC